MKENSLIFNPQDWPLSSANVSSPLKLAEDKGQSLERKINNQENEPQTRNNEIIKNTEAKLIPFFSTLFQDLPIK